MNSANAPVVQVSPKAASLFVASLKSSARPQATSFVTAEALQKGGVNSFVAAPGGGSASGAPVARYKKLGFFITKVKRP
jgi:hypothetical protein